MRSQSVILYQKHKTKFMIFMYFYVRAKALPFINIDNIYSVTLRHEQWWWIHRPRLT